MSSVKFSYIAGFWRRSFAFLIDLLLVGGFCWSTIRLLSNFLHQFPVISIFIGYFFVVLYFGLLNSHLHSGQTFGKQLLKIRVADTHGKDLAVIPSLLRSSILFAPSCLMSLSGYFPILLLSELFNLLLACLQILLIYFYIFNRQNRRSIHDFVVGSMVINLKKDDQEQQVPEMWTKHKIFAALITLVGLGIGISSFNLFDRDNTVEINNFKGGQPEIVHVKRILEMEDGSEAQLILFDVQINDPIKLKNSFFAQEFADNLQRLEPQLINDSSKISILLSTRLQFGLASSMDLNMYSVKKTQQGLKVVEEISTVNF
ncbi:MULTISPECIES: RDD family protein [Acinetobacter]|uniref:RDD family protein n=1 Tax=Acinetobacter TaxID=469 RepID=UPI00051C38BA|nr:MULTISPECIES: RDD family protein [Acinetobacter]MCH7303798.1 RDD family protein [Acinetobacter higginsii]MCH7379134.1 RDD family protein [Acinetobacter higginsii]MCJ0828039.1 RDD family protein [Acinetobacter sp. NIPH1876]